MRTVIPVAVNAALVGQGMKYWKTRVCMLILLSVQVLVNLVLFYHCQLLWLHCLSACSQTPGRSTREDARTHTDSPALPCAFEGNRWHLEQNMEHNIPFDLWADGCWHREEGRTIHTRLPEAQGGSRTSPTKWPFCLLPKSRLSLFSRKLQSLP